MVPMIEVLAEVVGRSSSCDQSTERMAEQGAAARADGRCSCSATFVTSPTNSSIV